MIFFLALLAFFLLGLGLGWHAGFTQGLKIRSQK